LRNLPPEFYEDPFSVSQAAVAADQRAIVAALKHAGAR
jgi:hypothetical protein